MWGAIALVLAACLGCGGGGGSDRRTRGDASVGGSVVATVDGVGIGADDAARYAQVHHKPLRESVHELESIELLAAESERRGLAQLRSVREGTVLAAVQRLLEIEVEEPTEHVTPEQVAAAYEENRARYTVPELRASTHVLVRLGEGASEEQVARATTFVRGVLDSARAASDPVELLRTHDATMANGRPVVVEELPPYPRTGALVEPYAEAMFSLDAPGIVPEPVRTRFGVHGIVLTAITPERVTPLSDVQEALTAEVRNRARAERLAALLARIEREAPPTRNEAAIRSALARMGQQEAP